MTLEQKIAALAERAYAALESTNGAPVERALLIGLAAGYDLHRAYRAERLLREALAPRIGWETDEQRDERQDRCRAQAAALVEGE